MMYITRAAGVLGSVKRSSIAMRHSHRLLSGLKKMDALKRKSIANQTDVSFSLFKSVVSTHAKDANFVFSPLSLHILLGLIANGASGKSRVELLTFLKSKSIEELNSLCLEGARVALADGKPLDGPSVSSANSIWVDRSVGGLKPSFKQIVEKDYMAVSNLVDFKNKGDEVIKEVNRWAEKETNGLINEILPPNSLNPDSMLILANALYFRGTWSYPFPNDLTRDDDFFLLNGRSVRAPFMTFTTKSSREYFRAFDGFKVLGLPYENGRDKRRFSMYIYLPDAKDGLSSLIEKFVSTPGFIERHLPNELVDLGRVRIPKFKIGFGFEASDVLNAHGVVIPFHPLGGGLSEMVDDEDLLYVSSIFHKSFVELDEAGTEAAAVSAGGATAGCSMIKKPRKLPDFVADHPFVFVIREDTTGVVLFIGQLLNPIAD